MGCGASQAQQINNPSYSANSPLIDNLSQADKQKLSSLIEKDDVNALAVEMEKIKAQANSLISDKGSRWMLNHLCCRWDADNCLQYLLKDFFINFSNKYIDYVNSRTSNGYTCLHLCAIWKSQKCFYVLHYYGGLDLMARDNAYKTAYIYASEYKAEKIKDTLHKYLSLDVNFTQLEGQKLLSGDFIAEDEEAQQKAKQNRETKEIKIQKPIEASAQQKVILEKLSLLEKTMIEQKKKLQKQREEILQERLKQQIQADAQKAKNQAQQLQSQKEHKEAPAQNTKHEVSEQAKKAQEKTLQDLKAKEQEIKKINADLKKKQQERLRQQREEAQKKAEELAKQRQEQINKKLKQKQDAIEKLKKQQQEKQRRQKEQAEKKATLQAQTLANQNAQQTTVKESNLQQTGQKTTKVAENQQKTDTNPVSPPSKNHEILNSGLTDLKAAFAKNKQQLPDNIIKLYTTAKTAGIFTDQEFPANNTSIGDPSKKNFAQFTLNTIWLRPKDIFKGDFKLFDGIDPNDVKQGSLGVCYMLATVSSLAANPKNIEKLFIFADTSIGFYILKFFINGKPKILIVDDQIPCNKVMKSPLFTKPIGNQVWVLLLEKAWAKVIGDYLSAQAMTPDHMMQDLTAAPGYGSWLQKQANKSNTEHIKQIFEHSSRGHIVVVTSTDKKIEGIASDHAYNILKVFQVNNRYIFKVRNPWGRFEWNGEYGDKSALWTPQLKKLVGYEDKDDGVFHISENQFTKIFVYYSICEINDGSIYSYTEFKSKKDEDLFYRVKVTKNGPINIRVTQPFDRMLKDKNYKYSPLIFQVGKINSDKDVKFIAEGHNKSYFGAKSVHAFEGIIQQAEAGDYFIRIRMLWSNEEKYNSGVLAFYGNQAVTFEKIDKDKGIRYMKAFFLSQSTKVQRNPIGDSAFYKISTMKGQFVIIGETQKPQAQRITIKVNRSKMQLAELDLGKKNENELEMVVNKGQPGIVTVRRTQPAKGGMTGPLSFTIDQL